MLAYVKEKGGDCFTSFAMTDEEDEKTIAMFNR
jgi:hypothetical protein